MGAPDEILGLINRFQEQYDSYRAPSYNETALRREFVDPFFKSLGWDIDNKQGHAEAVKEVIHEDSIKIGDAMKAPDYCFRTGPARKFFVETKKPAVNIREDAAPAYQLRRYGWSAKLPLSILTDFEEFAVYDCRIRPDKNDKASAARTLYLTFQQYDERWEDIASIFSRDAVWKGSFDKYAESNKKKRGTAEVDAAFLDEIEQWRNDLAKNIALRNPQLSQRELNTAVQKTIDRIIFLRICEDRGIERHGRLQALMNGPAVYKRLCELFHDADTKYNSGLFHFHAERDRNEPPDEWTLALDIDDRVLKAILRHLYYPDSPYEFSVLGADILGQVYEQFLGKVIRLTKGHQARIEDKPEVKKAGGVYYTPTYIVDYIVANTVGKLVDGRQPHEVAARTKKTWKRKKPPVAGFARIQPPADPEESELLRVQLQKKAAMPLSVLDPACGSGSFLIGAYQYLLDWYRDRYVEDGPQKHKQRLYQTRGDEWRLTTDERKRILLDHIYGVDIDPQAVEVTKLSLLLKVLEGETRETLQRQLFAKQRALPDLSNNIKCGNSLIGPDFYQGRQMDLFDEEERLRINVFDWQTEFAEIMRTGGFDAVIGNPPYIRIQTMKEWAPVEVNFYKRGFRAASKGNYDIYVVFVERGLQLLSSTSRLGFILPHKFFNASYGESIRSLLASGRHVSQIVHFGHQQVFAGATTYTCLLFLEGAGVDRCEFSAVNDLEGFQRNDPLNIDEISAEEITDAAWNFGAGSSVQVIEKLRDFPDQLGTIATRLAQGIRTSANEIYVLDVRSTHENTVVAYSKSLDRDVELERDSISWFLQGREIKAYELRPSGKVVLNPYRIVDGKAELIPIEEIQKRWPSTFAYFRENKAALEKREKGRFRGQAWHAYGRLQNVDLMLLPKLLVPDIADRAAFAIDTDGIFAFTSGYGITFNESTQESPLYVLGLLNSSVLDLYLKNVSTPLRGGFFRYFTQFIRQLPIRRIDFDSDADVGRHQRMIDLVEQMLALHKQSASVKTAHERTAVQRQMAATDREIDSLVYELYGLSDEEIRLVEEATSS